MHRFQQVTVNEITYDVDQLETIDAGIAAGGWEPEVKQCMARFIKAGMTVLDIGANVGAHTLTMAQMVGPLGMVYAFEPMHWAFMKLLHNLQLNPALYARVTPLKFALGQERRVGTFHFRSSWHELGKGRQDDPCEGIMLRLDDWAEGRDIGLIKIDVDGMEYDVFSGGRNSIRHARPVIVTEIVSKHFEPDRDLLLLLAGWGYRFESLAGDKWSYTDIRQMLPGHDPDMTTSTNIVAIP
jgi:FkbM family methyltransferase